MIYLFLVYMFWSWFNNYFNFILYNTRTSTFNMHFLFNRIGTKAIRISFILLLHSFSFILDTKISILHSLKTRQFGSCIFILPVSWSKLIYAIQDIWYFQCKINFISPKAVFSRVAVATSENTSFSVQEWNKIRSYTVTNQIFCFFYAFIYDN